MMGWTMEMKILAIVLALTSVAVGQSLDAIGALADLPTCSTSCLSDAVTSNGCITTDYACQCSRMDAIESGLETCIQGSCNQADQDRVRTLYVQDLCNSSSGNASPSAGTSADTSPTPAPVADVQSTQRPVNEALSSTSVQPERSPTSTNTNPTMVTVAPPATERSANPSTQTATEKSSEPSVPPSLTTSTGRASGSSAEAQSSNKHEPLLSTGEIAGVAFGSVVGGVLVIAALVFCFLRGRKQRRIQQGDAAYMTSESAVNLARLDKAIERSVVAEVREDNPQRPPTAGRPSTATAGRPSIATRDTTLRTPTPLGNHGRAPSRQTAGSPRPSAASPRPRASSRQKIEFTPR